MHRAYIHGIAAEKSTGIQTCRMVLCNFLQKPLVREFFAECLGTFVLIVMALTAIAQHVLGGEGKGSQATISWATGLGVTMGVFVSGGHINPAVSLTMAVLGRLPWYKLPVYVMGQFLGSFLASAITFLVYLDALDNYDGGLRQVSGDNATGIIWATYPQPYVTTRSGLIDQIFATSFLLVCILAISDQRNMGPGPRAPLTPVCLGLIVVATNMTLALNCGNAMNPARDFPPRLFTAIAGWGVEPFSFRNYNWFWVPVVGPLIGALLGAGIYQGLVGRHWSLEVETERPAGDGGRGDNDTAAASPTDALLPELKRLASYS